MASTVAPERSNVLDRRRAGLLGASVAAVVAVIAGAAWWASGLGGRTWAVVLSVLLTGVGAALVGRIGSSAGGLARRAAVATTLVAGAMLLVLAWTGTLVAVKHRASISRWTEAAEAALAEPDDGGAVCRSFVAIPGERLPGFGRVDERCVSRVPGHRAVSFHQRDPSGGWASVLYSPDGPPTVSSTCLAPLHGAWWQTASADPNCPAGYTFVGGG